MDNVDLIVFRERLVTSLETWLKDTLIPIREEFDKLNLKNNEYPLDDLTLYAKILTKLSSDAEYDLEKLCLHGSKLNFETANDFQKSRLLLKLFPFSKFNPKARIQKDVAEFGIALSRIQIIFAEALRKLLIAAEAKNVPEARKALLYAREIIVDLISNVKDAAQIATRKISESTRLTPTEIRAARVALYTSLLATVGTVGLQLFRGYGHHSMEMENSKKELFSEYKIRLFETEQAFNFNLRTNTVLRTNILNLIDGGYAKINDSRSQLGLDRIIRDLQIQYELNKDSDDAVQAVLNLRQVVNGSEIYDAAVISNNFSALNNFAKDNSANLNSPFYLKFIEYLGD